MTPSLHRTMPVAAPDTWRVLLLFLAALASILLAALASGCSDEEEVEPNAGPTAKAGTDQAVNESASVTLDGSASGDVDGWIAGYAWTQLQGTPVALSDYGAAKPTFTAPAIASGSETLVFRLTVTDNGGSTHSDNVAVTVQNVSADAGQAKYVILLIGDGMQLAHEVAASRYLYAYDKGLVQHSLPYQTICSTWDVTTYDRYAWASGGTQYAEATFDPLVGYNPAVGGSWTYDGTWAPPSDAYFLTKLFKWGGTSAGYPATDSASAGTALSCGTKTDDGNICWLPGDPAGGDLDSIGESARAAKGMAYGVVSTVQFCHATPAVFVAHNVSRNNYTAIATEVINTTRPDVVIGAGHPNWTGGAPPAYTYITSTDYNGLVAGSAAPYTEYRFVQRVATQNGTTNLNAAVTDILNPAHASYNKKLFGLFGGNGNYMEYPVPSDAPGAPAFTWTTNENPTLADCTTAALKVLNLRGGSNGFFLMVEGGDIDWANHASDYSWMIGATYQFDRAVKAVVDYVDDPATPQTWSNTLVIVTADHANSYLRFTPGVWLGKGDLPTQTVTTPPTYPGGEVYYGVNDSHTNEPVMVYARGIGTTLFAEYEGAWYPGTRMVDNTHIFQVMRRALGLP
jgi:alkaline phosphatase